MPKGVPKNKEVTAETVEDAANATWTAAEPRAETVVEVEPEVLCEPMPPPPVTMDDAFHMLCKAVINSLEALPDLARVRDIQIRYADGHRQLAWQQIWRITEEVVGVPY